MAPTSPPSFRFTHEVEVRFRDTDVGGHVHHSQALIYVEEARWAYWDQVAGRRGIDAVDYILAEARVRYRRRMLYPARLGVVVRVASVGRTHFEMDYEIRDPEGVCLVTATTVQVMYDYGEGRSVRVPDELRRRLEAFEGPLPFRRGS